jgi:hypothetical protein
VEAREVPSANNGIGTRYAFNATGDDGLDARSVRRVAGRLIRRHLWQDQVTRAWLARKAAQK